MNTSLLTFFQVNTAPQKDETIDVMGLEKLTHTIFLPELKQYWTTSHCNRSLLRARKVEYWSKTNINK